MSDAHTKARNAAIQLNPIFVAANSYWQDNGFGELIDTLDLYFWLANQDGMDAFS